jgi:hypothetical protein
LIDLIGVMGRWQKIAQAAAGNVARRPSTKKTPASGP